MKKLKLFLTSIITMFVAAVGVHAATSTICTANNETAFKSCLSSSDRVIQVTGSYELSGNVIVDNKRVVIDDSKTLTITGKLELVNFAVNDSDDDIYVTGVGDIVNNKLINVLLDTSSKLIVKDELVASTSGGNTIAISKRSERGWYTDEGTLEVDGGKVSISGYGHTAVRTNAVVLKNGGKLEVSNCAHAANIGNMTVSENSEYYSHDNDRGLTTANGLIAEDNAKLTVENNKLSGIYTSGTISDDATIVSNNNGEEDIGVTGNGLTFKDNATLEAGSVLAPYGGVNAKLTVQTGGNNNVTLKVSHITNDVFTAPESGITGVVRVGDLLHVYSVDNDTLEITLEDIAADGTVKVKNHIGKDLKVTTADSSVVKTLNDGAEGTYNLIKITAKVGDDVAEGVVLLFKNQKFGELSKVGKNKLDTMLAVEGKQIDSYLANKKVLAADSELTNDTEVTATYSDIKADYTKLDELIEQASKINKKQYTEESYKKLEEALKEAKNLSRDLKIKDQVSIDNAVKKLENAIKGLEKVATNNPQTGDNILMYLSLGLASVAVATLSVKKLKKSN